MDENKQIEIVSARKVIKISKRKVKKVIISILVLLVLLVAGLFFLKTRTFRTDNYNAMGIAPSIPNEFGSFDSSNYKTESLGIKIFNSSGQQSIRDTREFLKTDYRALVYTRNVSSVVKDIKNIIKGSDGRIDTSNSSERSGYVGFVVPKSNFESFRDEIESITHKKLYTESISSQNLLGQKQNIEQQTDNIVNTLSNLKNQKETLNSSHIQTIISINKELSRLKNEITTLRMAINDTTETSTLTVLKEQENSLLKKESIQKQKLLSENNNYTIQNQNLENSINNSNNNLTNVNGQDSQFTDNIETVNGYINVEWINLWQMAKIFSPIHPTLIVIALFIILGFYLNRKEKIPKIEFQ